MNGSVYSRLKPWRALASRWLRAGIMAILLLAILQRIDLPLVLDTLARFDWMYGMAMMGVYTSRG